MAYATASRQGKYGPHLDRSRELQCLPGGGPPVTNMCAIANRHVPFPSPASVFEASAIHKHVLSAGPCPAPGACPSSSRDATSICTREAHAPMAAREPLRGLQQQPCMHAITHTYLHLYVCMHACTRLCTFRCRSVCLLCS